MVREPAIPPFKQPPPEELVVRNSNHFFVFAILVLVCLGGLAGYFFSKMVSPSPNGTGTSLQVNRILSTPFPTNSSVTSASVPPDWITKSVEHVSWSQQWKSFKLSYPPQWNYNVARTTAPEGFTITLNRNTTTLKIMQVMGDSAACNYPDQPQIAGMAREYDTFTEIRKTDIIIWRNSHTKNPIENLPSYTVCEKSPVKTNFSGYTTIGLISIFDSANVYAENTIQEINGILERIEFLN